MKVEKFEITAIYNDLIIIKVNDEKTSMHVFDPQTQKIACLPRSQFLTKKDVHDWTENMIDPDQLQEAINFFHEGYKQGQRDYDLRNPDYPTNPHKLNGFFAGRLTPFTPLD